jgi:hypothetical protein
MFSTKSFKLKARRGAARRTRRDPVWLGFSGFSFFFFIVD